MNKLSAQEIIDILYKNYSLTNIGYMEYTECEEGSEAEKIYQSIPEDDPGSYREHEQLILDKLGLGFVKEVFQRGGSDQGSVWYSVQYFEEHDVYLRIDGYYTSYEGTYFEDLPYEVKPKEKTITVYE